MKILFNKVIKIIRKNIMKKYLVEKRYHMLGFAIVGRGNWDTQVVEAETDDEAIKKAKERSSGGFEYTIQKIYE